MLCDSEGEESPVVKEYGSEGRASWLVLDGIFFGEKNVIRWNSNFSWRIAF